ncbi:MAG: redox-regulated ATPase YchF [Verrucomicrobia bacterium]|jgi:ribosome-binding ATPase|nr:redox-regulated ATPase YchF [Verrucomicrobiota bacterium]
MKIALIGLPQAGKKTLFSLLTGRGVPEVRKPGETVEGVAHIRDARIDTVSEMCQTRSKVYAENHFVLCPDAVTGENSRGWLDAACRCDLLCLVVRAFASDQVYHPDGSVDGARDEENLKSELLFADMEMVEKRLERIEKEARAGLSADQKVEQATLQKCMAALEEGQRLIDLPLEPHEWAAVSSLGLLTFIPLLVTRNISEDELGSEPAQGTLLVSCLIEQEIEAMDDPADRKEYMDALGIESSGLDRMNAAAYDALGLMSYYTVGEDECRAWTIRKGSSAPVAGGKIHSDIERGFIRVEVIKYDDYVTAGSEVAAKEQGKMQTKGKDYILEDGDICHFLFNV